MWSYHLESDSEYRFNSEESVRNSLGIKNCQILKLIKIGHYNNNDIISLSNIFHPCNLNVKILR